MRPPRPDEAPPPWWHPLDDEPAVVLALVEAAFRDVRLAGGTTLDEAELIDGYALPARAETDQPPAAHVDPGPWQDLTRADLDRFPWGNFAFHDARGLSFYFPAYACAALTGESPASFDSLLYMLDGSYRVAALQSLLTPAQAHAVACFLAHVATGGGHAASTCRHALRRHWAHYLDAAHANLVTRCPP